MRQLSTQEKTDAYMAACEGGNVLKYKLVMRPQNKMLGDVTFTAENIVEGSLAVIQSCEGDGGLPVGAAALTSCDFELIGNSEIDNPFGNTVKELYENELLTFSGCSFALYAGQTIDDDIEWVLIGRYYTANEHYHYDNYRITAYDAMAYLDTQQIESTEDTPFYTLLSKVMENTPISTYRNEHDYFTGLDTIANIVIPGFEAMTKREFLKYACELFCAFCYVDYDGVLVFRTITSDAREYIAEYYGTDHMLDITDYSVFDEDYGFIPATGFHFTNTQAEIDEVLGTDTYLIEIANPFFLKLDASGRVVFNLPEARTRYGILVNNLQHQQFITGKLTRMANPLIERGDMLYKQEWLVSASGNRKINGKLFFATQIELNGGYMTSVISQQMEEPEYKDLRTLTKKNARIQTISGMVKLVEEESGSSIGIYTYTLPASVRRFGATYGVIVEDIDGGTATIRSRSASEIVIAGTTGHRVRYTITYGPGMES